DLREILDGLSQRYGLLVPLRRAVIIPVAAELGYGARIDVAGGRDDAGRTHLHGIQKPQFVAAEDAPAREPLKHGPGVLPVAGGILDAGDDTRICRDETLDQIEAEADLCDRRDVVEIDAQGWIADAVHHRAHIAVKPLIAHVLVVERRQHEHAAAAELGRAAAQGYRVAQRAGAGAGHHALGRKPLADEALEQPDLFLDTKRIAFAVGA